MSDNSTARKQRITQWVTGGRYAVAVKVEAVYPADDPSEACLSPETVRFLEDLAERAEAGDVEALCRAGKVYLQMTEGTATS